MGGFTRVPLYVKVDSITYEFMVNDGFNEPFPVGVIAKVIEECGFPVGKAFVVIWDCRPE